MSNTIYIINKAKKGLFLAIIIATGFFVAGFHPSIAYAQTVNFGNDGKMFAPNCHCNEDVSPYHLATWCGATSSTCNGQSGTYTTNVESGDYGVTVNLGSLSDFQRYEEVIININGRDFAIADLGGNGSSTGSARHSLGNMHLSGRITVSARHKYANTFTGGWYSDMATRFGSGSALESVEIVSVVFDRIAPPAPPEPICGAAHDQSFSSAPTTGLCGVGTASVVAHTNDRWTWTCTSGEHVVNCSAAEARVSIGIVKRNGDNSGDTQTITSGGRATFTITVTNTGEDNLTDIVIADAEASQCDRTAQQTHELYSGDLFDPQESFTYTCVDENVQAGYTNVAYVTGRVATSSQTVTAHDDSRVSLASDPADPVEPDDPEDEDDCDGAIGNDVWHDRNKNGIQDAGEEGIADVRLKLYNGDDIEKDTTNSLGHYKFKDLCEGSYRVVVAEETLPAGCYQTYDKDGVLDNASKTSIKNDEYNRKIDFGYYCPSTKSFTVSPQTGSGVWVWVISIIGACIVAVVVYRRKLIAK